MLRHIIQLMWMAFVFVTVPGCSTRTSEWRIDVRNQTSAPCSVRVEMGYTNASGQGNSEAHTDKMQPGESLTLIAGSLPTTIRTVVVGRGEEELKLTPNVEIRPGQQYQIVVPAEGPLQASIQVK